MSYCYLTNFMRSRPVGKVYHRTLETFFPSNREEFTALAICGEEICPAAIGYDKRWLESLGMVPCAECFKE